MTWVAWRYYRTELLIALAILAAMSAYLIPTGLDKRSLFDSLDLGACLTTGSEDCMSLRDRFVTSYNAENAVIGWFNFVPGVLGVLLAAPMILELEHRTFRLSWTQSVSRERWLVTTLGAAILATLAVSLLLTVLLTWFHAPIDRVDGDSGHLRESFGFEGVLPAAYTLFALSLGLASGALTRRIAIALPVSLVAFLFTRLTIEPLVRPGVQFGTTDGPASASLVGRDLERFWTYQAIEGAIFLALAVVLLLIAAWAIRKRV